LSDRASRGRIAAAFGAVYVIWGSTYLAILFAIETLPPFLMAGTRFVIAGAALYVWLRTRGTPTPVRVEWRSAAIVGVLLLLGGNGGVVWAEQHVASGVAALLVATVPLWMVLLEWARAGGERPGGAVGVGLALGTVGMLVLVGPDGFIAGERVDTVGAGVLVFASLSWATGSIYSRSARLAPGLMSTAQQMLVGGAALLLLGVLIGEPGRLDIGGASPRSLLALLYLIVFGSLIGYSCYVWLLRVSTPAKVSTYAYVNPLVAVVLGWLFAGESLSARIAVAALIIVGGVLVITTRRRPKKRPEERTPAPARP
jgi:drug/metabolite transporter (DMT)-like permease